MTDGGAGLDRAHSPPSRRFVVHRHRARRLHYDLRLEVGQALVSWAVPRGPSLDPTVRRQAFRVEDHSLDYFDFEGIIPAGQAGAGDVIVWDWGTWLPEAQTPDPAAAIAAGELKLTMRGEKLRGRFVLVRTGERWLLIHKRDEHAVAGWDPEAHPRSVLSGRTNDEVAAGVPALWLGQQPPDPARIDLAAAVASPLPGFIEPMLATPAQRAFTDPDWLFEVKWDGFRVQAIVSDGSVRLLTRAGNDAGANFPGLLAPATWLQAREAVIDGEVVALDSRGRADFSLLQRRLGAASPDIVLQAFDLLHLDGRALLEVPLEDRKRLLRLVVPDGGPVRCTGHVLADGEAFLRAAEEQGLEGIIAKRRASPYVPGTRSSDWLKVKLRPEQEFVVGGWTTQRGTRSTLASVAVGVHEGGRLRYAGMIGSGFSQRARRALQEALAPLRADLPPFAPVPGPGRWGRSRADRAEVVWVRPEVVIRAQFAGWTRDGLVRQASYKGIALDRDPTDVVREEPADAPQAPAGTPQPAAQPTVTTEELQRLAALDDHGTWRVTGRAVRLTNLDKVLFPARGEESPITKRDLVAYFAGIAPAMLPHLAGRPVNLHRFPDGADRPGFWQKNLPASAPRWLTRWHETLGDSAPRRGNAHLVVDSPAALIWLANQAAFEVHAWTGTCADPHRPTFALIDIDPGTATTWEQTLTIARLFRTALQHLGVRGYPKTTGARGVQIWVPVTPGRYSFEQTSAWVEGLSRTVGAVVPDLVSWQWARSGRGGRARLDYTQNAAMKTLVAPYAVRPAPGAPVSMPIAWSELDDPTLAPDRWTIRDAIRRVAQVGDLFAPAQADHQALPTL